MIIKQNFLFSYKLKLFLILFSFQAFTSEQLYHPDALTLIDDTYRLNLRVSQFATEGYFDATGNESTIDGANSFTMTNYDLAGHYGLTSKLEVGAGLRFRQNESKLSGNTTSNSGLESYFGAFKYRLYKSPHMVLSLIGDYRMATYDNKSYTQSSLVPSTDLVLGDGGDEYSFGGALSYKTSKDHFINLKGAYRAPGNDLSSEVFYRLDSVWKWKKIAFGIGVEGINSLKNDQYSATPTRKPFQATGATTLFNSVDRQYMDPFADIYYAFDSFRLGLHGQMRMSGQSTDKGKTLGMSFQYTSPQKEEKENKEDSFKEYNIEASIIKISPRGKFVQVDKGLSSDIVKGMEFDIYETDYFGKNVLIAEAFTYEVTVKTAILKITKKIKNIKVKKGHTVRGRQGL